MEDCGPPRGHMTANACVLTKKNTNKGGNGVQYSNNYMFVYSINATFNLIPVLHSNLIWR